MSNQASGKKLNVLISVGVYVPGFRGGGPIRSIANLVDWLGDEISFRIVTRDRDLGQSSRYPGIAPNQWQQVGKAQVCYLSPARQNLWSIRQLMLDSPADVLYLNSAFSPIFTIMPLLLMRLRSIPNVPTILAPRGEFFPDALRIKSFKKQNYLRLARMVGIYHVDVWQVSSAAEESEVRRIVNAKKTVAVRNLPQRYQLQRSRTPEKVPGVLRLVFVARIARIKNLDFAIACMRELSGDVEFSIYGPMEDSAYWERCEQLIRELPKNVRVKYEGEVAHEEIADAMAKHHAMLFPTQSENFGHVILEALSAGLLVVTSDQTPWRQLTEVQVGWDLPLHERRAFRAVLAELIGMGEEEYRRRSLRACEYAVSKSAPDESLEIYRRMFVNAAQESEGR